jgi:hypothetical protein
VDILHAHAATLIEKIKYKIGRSEYLKKYFHLQAELLEQKMKKCVEETSEKMAFNTFRVTSNEVRSCARACKLIFIPVDFFVVLILYA